MRFEHEFTVPVPVDQAWSVLLDVERLAPCLPGATLDSVEGDTATGRMRVRVGPLTVNYRGTARIANVDKDTRTVEVVVEGAHATGATEAAMTARLLEDTAGTRVTLVTTCATDLPQPVLDDVGARFAANLAALIEGRRHLTVVPDPVPESHPPGTLRTSRTAEEEAFDLREAAGASLVKRLAPVVGGLGAIGLIVYVVRRWGRR
ncbi:SRPBCC family protein [Herbidospora sp. NBRC 101105]|uniref:SRPBCC family protein n=1 Tax=Herbidospora sp. NBRC 101105 TaxID=3032195 RepID=UPI0024A36151|nr:SRPBCC family protein [Herbidospora sp. NBRC 101105]GLX95639.1 carbon monoxide dehydrogenase subunit G [Herbidospora sp. NBRC 101105]